MLRADGDPVGDGTAEDLGQGPPLLMGVASLSSAGSRSSQAFSASDAWIRELATQLARIDMVGPLLAALTSTLAGIAIGIVAGAGVLALQSLCQRLRGT